LVNLKGERQRQNDKQHDIDVLKQLNVQLGDAESKGEVEWLAGVIGPELAFR
jgi:hypothetical protein